MSPRFVHFRNIKKSEKHSSSILFKSWERIHLSVRRKKTLKWSPWWSSATNYFKTQTLSRFTVLCLFCVDFFLSRSYVFTLHIHKLGVSGAQCENVTALSFSFIKCIIEIKSKCQIHNTFVCQSSIKRCSPSDTACVCVYVGLIFRTT